MDELYNMLKEHGILGIVIGLLFGLAIYLIGVIRDLVKDAREERDLRNAEAKKERDSVATEARDERERRLADHNKHRTELLETFRDEREREAKLHRQQIEELTTAYTKAAHNQAEATREHTKAVKSLEETFRASAFTIPADFTPTTYTRTKSKKKKKTT